ncbi:hypothetical protein [Aeromonas veronii]|uniref:hypothetical protein n=1 Tax=Aeromonas veronii TaxID=654 RepID=UPI003D1BD641
MSDRKKAQRERDRQNGIKRIEIRLSADAQAALEQACQVRGGVRGPYELAEYIETLIRQDADKLALQLAQLDGVGGCQRCGSPLPGGCGGVHRGEAGCYHSRDYRQLMLTEPPRLSAAELDALLAKAQ